MIQRVVSLSHEPVLSAYIGIHLISSTCIIHPSLLLKPCRFGLEQLLHLSSVYVCSDGLTLRFSASPSLL